jgi:hypothetical protein
LFSQFVHDFFGDGAHMPIGVGGHENEVIGVIGFSNEIDDFEIEGFFLQRGTSNGKGCVNGIRGMAFGGGSFTTGRPKRFVLWTWWCRSPGNANSWWSRTSIGLFRAMRDAQHRSSVSSGAVFRGVVVRRAVFFRILDSQASSHANAGIGLKAIMMG